ncbi:BMP family ABC transporter substrate-binding protein [Labilibaculum sp. DW002]|uniref:BMP family ABC transporter substrate-binding protein n=1 Tax=Paralabilibaculum antarcticum TaxID=2912572 RepID=A0ABT5VXA1_9BACT|nr:BMP family ABC transporter substrate-binding protein [Labilibaculum sp. DW002]MDE5419880.1 BMP family ABC transporter substrate-binding protein [Labilibaculum sp. DW002]
MSVNIKLLKQIIILSIVSVIVFSCSKDETEITSNIDVIYSIGGLGDSYVDNIFKGVVQAKYDYQLSVNHLFPENISEVEFMIDSIITTDYNRLLILGDVAYADIMDKHSNEFLNEDILLLDGSTDADIWSVGFSFYGAAYLAGLTAAEINLCDTAAFIAGMPLPTLKDCYNGFSDGFLANGGKHVSLNYLDSGVSGFSMMEEAENLTRSLIDDVDLVVAAAGGSNLGIFNVIRENPKTLAIGIDTDQSHYAPKSIIGSITKNIDNLVLNCIQKYQDEGYSTGHTVYNLESSYTGFLLNSYFENSLNGIVTNGKDEAIRKENEYLEQK